MEIKFLTCSSPVHISNSIKVVLIELVLGVISESDRKQE